MFGIPWKTIVAFYLHIKEKSIQSFDENTPRSNTICLPRITEDASTLKKDVFFLDGQEKKR